MSYDLEYTVKLIFNLLGNHDPKTAVIEYWDDDVFLSSWEYNHSTGLVTATEKTDTYDVSFEEAFEARKNTLAWIDFISVHFSPAKYPRSIHRHVVIIGPTFVSSLIKIGGVTITDDIWTASTDKITYGPRPAVSWAWADYLTWREYRDQFIREIEIFKKG